MISVILFNPFPSKPWFLRVCSTSLLKTLPEKEKFLVTNNSSFSNSIFCHLENFLAFSLISKLLSANSFSLEESKICHLGKSSKILTYLLLSLPPTESLCKRKLTFNYFEEIFYLLEVSIYLIYSTNCHDKRTT